MKKINEDIKLNQFKNVYLLFGEEDYLKIQYRDKLVRAVMPEEDTMNYAHFAGKGLSEGEIIDLAETMPFFAEHRVIVLEDTGFFKNAAEKLPDYMKELPEYLVMVFVEQEVDKRNRMYKAVQKAGYAAEFAKQTEQTLLTWVAGILKKNQKSITRGDAEYLLSRTGTDMSNIYSEVEKLICYAYDRPVITKKDIDAVCTEQMENRIFEMIRAVSEILVAKTMCSNQSSNSLFLGVCLLASNVRCKNLPTANSPSSKVSKSSQLSAARCFTTEVTMMLLVFKNGFWLM